MIKNKNFRKFNVPCNYNSPNMVVNSVCNLFLAGFEKLANLLCLTDIQCVIMQKKLKNLGKGSFTAVLSWLLGVRGSITAIPWLSSCLFECVLLSLYQRPERSSFLPL